MRDEKRIDDFCESLKIAWHKYPDLRFGQLITDAAKEVGYGDIFYMEDETMKQAIIHFVETI